MISLRNDLYARMVLSANKYRDIKIESSPIMAINSSAVNILLESNSNVSGKIDIDYPLLKSESRHNSYNSINIIKKDYRKKEKTLYEEKIAVLKVELSEAEKLFSELKKNNTITNTVLISKLESKIIELKKKIK